SWKGTRNHQNPRKIYASALNFWSVVHSFGKPPKATGGLSYPNFKKHICSHHPDLLALLNSVIPSIPRILFPLLKLAVKIVNFFNIIE
ncbi:MAG: hypothetical protein ACOC44_19740, partial [Promethearchaeia archaeon]